jgi:hypothetical protein
VGTIWHQQTHAARGASLRGVLAAPYGVDVCEPTQTEAGPPTVTFDLGDGVLVFEPAPDNDAGHAWNRIRSVLEGD